MEYYAKLNELKQLKNSKIRECKIALAKYNTKGQMIISFDEVSRLKDDIQELSNFITALKRVFQKAS